MVLFLFIAIVCYIPQIDSFIPKTDFGEGIPDIDLFRLCSLFLFLFFVIHGVIKRDLRLMNKYLAILGLFYVIVVMSISWSVYAYDSYTLQIMFNSAFIPFLLTVIAMNLFEKQNIAQVYIKHVVIAAFTISLVSVFQVVSGLFAGAADFRAAGTFGNPNTLAVILVLTIPSILYATEKNLIPELLGKVVSISVIAGIIFTVSRKGIITMVVCYLMYNILKKNMKKVIVVSIGFVLLAAVVSGYSAVTQRFEKEEFQYHMNEKWEMVQAGVRMFKTSPLIGLGYEGYYENFRRFFTDAYKDKYSAHNIYITALANYGLLGFIPFLAIFFYPLMLSIRAVNRPAGLGEDDYTKDMAIVCLTSLVPFMMNGWFAGGLFYQPVPMAFFLANTSLFLAISVSQNKMPAEYTSR